MWKKLALFILLLPTSFAIGKKPDPTSYPDVPESKPPLVTIRSLNTGAPLSNYHYGERSPLNKHWELLDLTWEGRKYVQFRALGSDKCLSYGAAVIECSRYFGTAFELVTTDTGAFILMAYPDGSCLYSSGFGKYGLAHCNRETLLKGNPVHLRFLWTLSPPFGRSKLLVPPVK